MTAKEAKAISDKVMEELRFRSREFIERRIIKDIKAVASRGEYEIELSCLNKVDAEVLASEPYCYKVVKSEYGNKYMVSWREMVQSEFRFDDI